MSNGQRVVIHIGAPKTGSTSLQRGVLGGNASISHFGEVGDGTTSESEEQVIRKIFDVDDVFYSEPEVREVIRHRVLSSKRPTLVFSSADVLHSNNPTRAASRLCRLFGEEAKVILIIRHQIEALLSYYAGHGAWLSPAPEPFFRQFVDLHDWLNYQWLLLPESRLRTYSYWDQIRPFVECFGIENVYVFTFEDLVVGHPESWGAIGEILGVDSRSALEQFRGRNDRPRPKAVDFWWARILRTVPFASGRLGRRPSSRKRIGPDFRPKLTSLETERLEDFYRFGNLLIQDAFDLDLERHDYPGLRNGSTQG